jgi:phosphoserine aminotransferase
MSKRAHIFNAGPAVLPVEVVETVSKSVAEYQGLGLSVVEMSHRSKPYDEIHTTAMKNLRDVYDIPEDYEIIFMQGGASMQFAMIPMNFLNPGETACYVDTGAWSTKAIKEAKNIGEVKVIATSEDKKFTYIPKNIPDEKCAYVHITSNNTIRGTQFFDYPELKNAPLICDMSSDILCKKTDISKFSMIYAGAQKNIGPSGLTVIIIKKSFLEKASQKIGYLNYKTHHKANSLSNTPCTFATYAMGEVLKWIKKSGGIQAIEKINKEKAGLLYDAIDNSGGYYSAPVEKDDRSWMNIPFRLPSEELEAKFLKEATAKNLIGLKGHRSVGGMRASMYNALPMESAQALVDFMAEFKKNN